MQSSRWLSALPKLTLFHFYIIAISLLMHMLNWSIPYRLFAYLNLLMLPLILQVKMTQADLKTVIWVCVPLMAFLILNVLASQSAELTKELRHLMLATGFAIGIWSLAKPEPIAGGRITWVALGVITLYALVQCIYLFVLNKPFGSTKNPHYLAQYCMLMLPVGIYLYLQANKVGRICLLLILAFLLLALLATSSRPAWLALIVSFVGYLLLSGKAYRLRSLLILTIALVFFAVTDVFHVASRLTELVSNLAHEERVVIWMDALRMQQDSGWLHWLIGHGITGFEQDFINYSQYHTNHIDFNSPHNFVIELLYIAGIAGLLVFFGLLYLLYRMIIKGTKLTNLNRPLYLLMFVILTSHLFFLSITMPFFSSYNLNILGFVAGILLYLREIEKA